MDLLRARFLGHLLFGAGLAAGSAARIVETAATGIVTAYQKPYLRLSDAGGKIKKSRELFMKTKLWGTGFLAIILLGVGYAYLRNTEQQPVPGGSISTFTCGDFIVSLPPSWHAWGRVPTDETDSDTTYAHHCIAATFPESLFEEQVLGIGHLTKSGEDAFVTLDVRVGITRSLAAYIDTLYCSKGDNCMEPYIESKTAMPFAGGEAFKVVDSGGEYPAATTYYYKKGDVVLSIGFDMENTLRKNDILSIAESVK